MDSKDRKAFDLRRLLRSFTYAWNGLMFVIKNEQNMRIHLSAAFLVILLAIFLDISRSQFILLFIVIGIVLSLEMMNTAIEKTIDLITADYHPLAKVAKDVAAGAVFLFSLIAVIIGFFIFLPPLLKLF